MGKKDITVQNIYNIIIIPIYKIIYLKCGHQVFTIFREPRFYEILHFDYLLENDKQCSDVTMLDCGHCSGQAL